MLYLQSIVLGLLLTIALIPRLMKWADKLRRVDHTGGRKVHQNAAPRVGRIGMEIGTSPPVMLWVAKSPSVIAFHVGTGVLFFESVG